MLKNNQKWLILIATGIMIMLVNLDMTIVNLALAVIAKHFNATLNQTQWILSSYLLAAAVSFTVFGRLADIAGRKKIFLMGVALFTLASALAACSPNILILMIARFIQGLGFAATLGLCLVIIFSSFPPEQRGLAAGVSVGITGFAQAIGPTLGGLLVQQLGWQSIFWINVPLGVVSFFMTFIVTPKDTPKTEESLDLKMTFLFVFGLSLVLFALNELEVFSAIITVFSLFLGCLLLGISFYFCYTKPKPLINIELLNHSGYRKLIILRFISMMFMSSALFLIPLYLENILGYSPAITGVILLSMTLFVAISSPITGKLMDRISFVIPVKLSMLLAFLAAVTMIFFRLENPMPLLLVGLVLFGLAIGIHTPAMVNGVTKEVLNEQAGTAMGLFFTAAISGATVGVALSGAVMKVMSTQYLVKELGGKIVNNSVYDVAGGIKSVKTLDSVYLRHMAENAFMYAYHYWMSIISVLLLISVGIAFNLSRVKTSNSKPPNFAAEI